MTSTHSSERESRHVDEDRRHHRVEVVKFALFDLGMLEPVEGACQACTY